MFIRKTEYNVVFIFNEVIQMWSAYLSYGMVTVVQTEHDV